MPGELPFFVTGKIANIYADTAYVKVPTGNVYHIHPNTQGIEFGRLKKDLIIQCEVTTMLTRVLSARIVEE